MSESEFQRTIHEVNHARSVRLFAAECTLAAIRAALESDDFKRDVLNRADLRGISLNVSMALNVYRNRLLAILDGNQAPSATTPGSEEADDAR